MASRKGHLDVVNRLLYCKEIDANVQTVVSGIVWFRHILISKISSELESLELKKLWAFQTGPS